MTGLTGGQPGGGPAEPTRGAVIVAGGGGRRLGGIDKPALVVAGRTLLDAAIAACAGSADIVVVGPRRPTGRPVRWTVEEPPGSGPLAALAAGVAELGAGVTSVAVLAADLPGVSAADVAGLHDALAGEPADAAVVVDDDGHLQPLFAVYDRPALTTALAALAALGDLRGRALRQILDHLTITTRAAGQAAEDIDTPADLARWTTGIVDPMSHHAIRAKGTQMTIDAFVAALCERLNVPVDDVDVNALLNLTKDVAHNVERPAAPLAAFIAGYAVGAQGGGPEAIDETLDATAEVADEWADTHGSPADDQTPPLVATDPGDTTDTGDPADPEA